MPLGAAETPSRANQVDSRDDLGINFVALGTDQLAWMILVALGWSGLWLLWGWRGLHGSDSRLLGERPPWTLQGERADLGQPLCAWHDWQERPLLVQQEGQTATVVMAGWKDRTEVTSMALTSSADDSGMASVPGTGRSLSCGFW